jgi:murein DD-endopeptidase MepM/ murein hydrolase activator NlpD
MLWLLALFASFCLGVLVDGWLRTSGAPKPVETAALQLPTPAEPIVAAAQPPVNHPVEPASEPTMAATPAEQPTMAAASADAPIMVATPGAPTGDRAPTPLRMPIDGISIESFKGGFAQKRGDVPHEAVDIVVPRGTPIHAVSDGTIAKLFYSRFGGITIYQFERDGRLCFYYAHLQRYADGLHEGQHVSQGEVIGFVGTSGNAPPGTPHLHFGIFELNADRKWWQGRPLDPYLVFKQMG